MKNLIVICSFLLVSTFAFSQAENSDFFKNNPPSQRPPIFAASMPPCLIGVAKQYGSHLKLKKSTLKKVDEIIAEAHKEVPHYKKKNKIFRT